MPKKYESVFIDTSCFILLSKIKRLQLLKIVFEEVEIGTSEIVLNEFGKPLPKWIAINQKLDKNYQKLLELRIDAGEASILALALKHSKSLLVLDDLKARQLAQRLNLHFTGTLGILLKAKQIKAIPSLQSELDKIQQTNFRFSEQIYVQILNQAGEGSR